MSRRNNRSKNKQQHELEVRGVGRGRNLSLPKGVH
jgi:hypothetical protein